MDIIISLITIFSLLIIGLLTLRHNSKSLQNRFFFLLCLGLSTTTAFQAFQNIFLDTSVKIIFLRFLIFSATFTVLQFLFFATSFPQNSYPYTKKVSYIIIAITVLLMVLNLTPLIFSSVNENGDLTVGPLIPIYLIHIILCLGIGLGTLFKKLIQTKSIKRAQITFIFLGLLFTFSLIIISDIALPIVFKINYLQSLGSFAPLIFSFLTYYAIIKHRLLDISLALRRSLIVFMNSAFMYLLTFCIMMIINTFNQDYSFATIALFSTSIILPSLFANETYELVTDFIDKVFFGKLINKQDAIKRLTKKLADNILMNDLIQIFDDILKISFGISDIKILVYDNKVSNESFTLNYQSTLLNEFVKESNIESFITDLNSPMLKFEIIQYFNDKNLEKLLNKYSIEVLIPLKANKVLVGLIALGEKQANDYFSKSDLTLLEDFADRAGIALYNSLLYYQTQNFNKLLQQKVEQATTEVKKQKEEIEDQYQTERDMMGIIGHELRTPLTIAKGNIEYILKKFENANIEVNDQQNDVTLKLIKKLTDSFDSIKKEADLVQTMLTTSHVDRNKIDLNPDTHNIVDIAKLSIKDYINESVRKKLQLIFIQPDHQIPLVYADPLRMTEVTNNLISNAVKYTDNGSVTVYITNDENFVYINVKDTGRGINTDDLKSLGKKFFRVENYLDERKTLPRPGGTGLGLYVVKGILEASGGKLIIDSAIGVGSTFTAQVPRSTTIEDQNATSNDEIKEETDMFVKMGLKPKE